MGYSTRLCNASPFDVSWTISPGVTINLKPDEVMDMTPGMVEVFNPNLPGYSNVRELMDAHCVFVYDPDRDYEAQVLDVLRSWYRMRDVQYREARRAQEDIRANRNLPNDDEALLAVMVRLGYGAILERMEKVKARIDALEKVVKKVNKIAGQKAYDPERTIFVLDQPKEFVTKTMMEIFLAENPDVKERHDKWVAAQKRPSKKVEGEVSANV